MQHPLLRLAAAQHAFYRRRSGSSRDLRPLWSSSCINISKRPISPGGKPLAGEPVEVVAGQVDVNRSGSLCRKGMVRLTSSSRSVGENLNMGRQAVGRQANGGAGERQGVGLNFGGLAPSISHY